MKVRDRVVELRRIKASELVPNPKNWRTHPVGQQDALKELLADVGYADALLARETPDGLMLIDGHLRAETTPDSEVPVLVLDVTEDEADKILLTLDPLAALAGVDSESLGSLLDSVKLESADLLDYLGGQADRKNPRPGFTDPDAIPEAPEPITKPGDLWLLGEHRVLCGDSTKREDVERVMDGQQVGAVLTDPPYGIDLDTDYSKITGSKNSIAIREGKRRVVAVDYRRVEGDTQPFDASMLSDLLAYVAEQFWFGANYYRRTLPGGDLEGSWLVWDKRPSGWNDEGAGIDDVIGAGFELVWSKRKHQQRVMRQQWSGFTARNPDFVRAHPTEKPVALLTDILERWTPEGCTVIDPFFGAGSTLIASEHASRRCLGIEIDPRYVDVICRRYQEHTLDLPRRADTGEAVDFTDGG